MSTDLPNINEKISQYLMVFGDVVFIKTDETVMEMYELGYIVDVNNQKTPLESGYYYMLELTESGCSLAENIRLFKEL